MPSMIQNKEQFLNRIANQLGRKRRTENVTVPLWKKRPQYELYNDLTENELIEVFVKQCKKVHTKVMVTTKENLKQTFHEAMAFLGRGSVIYWKDDRFTYFDLHSALQKEAIDYGVKVVEWDPQLEKYNMKAAEMANIGITFSDITLAESATVVTFSGDGKGRSVSLLPRKYLALIPKSTLVARFTQASEKIHQLVQEKRLIPASINFISGPSNSADIELRLVVGVHGPVEALYIVIDDK